MCHGSRTDATERYRTSLNGLVMRNLASGMCFRPTQEVKASPITAVSPDLQTVVAVPTVFENPCSFYVGSDICSKEEEDCN